MESTAHWQGTAATLLDALGRLDEDAKHRLPRGPRGLTAALDRLAPNLRRLGIRFARGPRGDVRALTLSKDGATPPAGQGEPPATTRAPGPSKRAEVASDRTSGPCAECGSEDARCGAREGCGTCQARTPDDDWGTL